MAFTPSLPSKNLQQGFTLLEVLIAMSVFLMASSAIIMQTGSLFANNSRNQNYYLSIANAQDLLAVIEGNPALLPTLDGLSLAQATDPTLVNLWNSIQTAQPFLQDITITTNPTNCQSTQPCQIKAQIVTTRPIYPGAPPPTFLLQDGF